MDNVELTTLASVGAILGGLYSYIKDRVETGKALGKLEQRVETLEHGQRVLEDLVTTLTETRIAVTRLEQKVDSINKYIERNGN